MKIFFATDGTQMEHRWDVHQKASHALSVFHRCFICGSKNLFLLWLLVASVWPVVAQPSADFEAANKLFEQGRFADAAGAYGTPRTLGR